MLNVKIVVMTLVLIFNWFLRDNTLYKKNILNFWINYKLYFIQTHLNMEQVHKYLYRVSSETA